MLIECDKIQTCLYVENKTRLLSTLIFFPPFFLLSSSCLQEKNTRVLRSLRYGASFYSSVTIVFQINVLPVGSASEICHTYTCKIYFKELSVM